MKGDKPIKKYIWPEITKDTPIEEVKTIYRLIWSYVIKYGEKPKTNYPHNCVACAYANLYTGSHEDVAVVDGFGNEYTVFNYCLHCPIKWPNNIFCPSNQSLFYRWALLFHSYKERMGIANQIRDIPWLSEEEMHK